MRQIVRKISPYVTFALLPLAGCSQEAPDLQPQLRPVRAVQVFSTGGARERSFSGVAKSGVEAKISFKVPGTIEALPVAVGTVVKKGQLIARLDPTDYELQVEDAQASLVQARARLRNATSDYDRVRDLYENRNASKADLDAARAAYESAEAGVESASKRLELAKRQLEYTRLTAPLDGSIARCDVEINENVREGQVICLLNSDSDLEVEVAMPGTLISGIREGSPVTVTFDASPNERFPATVTEVGVASTGATTTFPVTVRLDRTDRRIRSGMAADVTFTFDTGDRAERYLVPGFAVGEDRDGRFVFVVEASEDSGVGIVQRKPVSIGAITDEGLEVTTGLEDGEFVVTAGVTKLADGQKVRFDAPSQGSAE